jgi:hypothetical protein
MELCPYSQVRKYRLGGNVDWVHTNEKRMVFDLKNLHPLARLVFANKVETGIFKLVYELGIDLVPMPMPFLDDLDTAIQRSRLGPLSTLLEDGFPQTKAHGAAHVLPVELRHVDDHTVLGLGIKLFRCGFGHVA